MCIPPLALCITCATGIYRCHKIRPCPKPYIVFSSKESYEKNLTLFKKTEKKHNSYRLKKNFDDLIFDWPIERKWLD